MIAYDLLTTIHPHWLDCLPHRLLWCSLLEWRNCMGSDGFLLWTLRWLSLKGTVSPQTPSPGTVSSLLCSGLPAPYCTRTHRTMLHSLICTALHAHAPHCITPHWYAQYCIVLHLHTPYCIILLSHAPYCTQNTALTCTALQNTAFTRTDLHHTALICTPLHHTALIYTATMHCQQHVLTTATLGRSTLCKTSNLTRWLAALPPGMQLWCSYCSMHSGAYSTPTSGDGSSMCCAVTAHRSAYCSAALLYRAATV